MSEDKAMAAPVCEHYWAWVSPAGTGESAHLCMSCGQPDADWLNEIAQAHRDAAADALTEAADALDALLIRAAARLRRKHRPETPNWLRERAADLKATP